MKNSSRLLAEIARNFSRSSSGCAAIGGFLENAAVEVQPGQFTVDEAVRAGGQRRGDMTLRRYAQPRRRFQPLHLSGFERDGSRLAAIDHRGSLFLELHPCRPSLQFDDTPPPDKGAWLWPSSLRRRRWRRSPVCLLPPFGIKGLARHRRRSPRYASPRKISAASARVAGRLCRSASLSSAITAARAAANERSMRVER